MPQLGELVQMISALSGVQNDRRKLDQNAEQLKQQASQFAQLGNEREFARALELISKSSSKTREGLEGALQYIAPHYKGAVEAFLHGQPVDPGTQAAEASQAGYAAAGPVGQGVLNQEAATRTMAGMNVGQVGASQIGGQLAAGAPVSPDQQGGYVQRLATGQTPVQAATDASQVAQGLVPFMAKTSAGAALTAPQAAQNTIAQGQLAVATGQLGLGWAGLDQNERKLAADYGLEKMYKTAEAMHALGMGKAALTGQERLEAMKAMSTIINDINNPKSDKEGNKGRIRIYNNLADVTGQPELKLPDPGGVNETPGSSSAFHQFMQSISGFGPGVPAPSGSPALPTQAPIQQQPVAPIPFPSAPDWKPAPAWPGARP